MITSLLYRLDDSDNVFAQDASVTTMKLSCPDGEDSVACGFAEPVTVTAGPSTFHAEEAFESISVVLDCQVTGTTEATCVETYVGPAGLIEDMDSATDDPYTNTDITTTTVTTVLSPSDMAWIPVTITAGGGSNSTTTHSSGSAHTSHASTTSGSSSTTGGRQTSGTGSATANPTQSLATASPNSANKADYRVLGWTAMGAGLMGLTIFWL